MPYIGPESYKQQNTDGRGQHGSLGQEEQVPGVGTIWRVYWHTDPERMGRFFKISTAGIKVTD